MEFAPAFSRKIRERGQECCDSLTWMKAHQEAELSGEGAGQLRASLRAETRVVNPARIRGREISPTKSSSSLRGPAGNGQKFYTCPQKRKPRGLQTNSCSKLRLQTSLGTEKKPRSVPNGHFAAKKVPPTGSHPVGNHQDRKQTQKTQCWEKYVFSSFKTKTTENYTDSSASHSPSPAVLPPQQNQTDF